MLHHCTLISTKSQSNWMNTIEKSTEKLKLTERHAIFVCFFFWKGVLITQGNNQIFIGRIPIMLRSEYCALSKLSSSELYEFGECPYDQGGYFVIHGKRLWLNLKNKTRNSETFKNDKLVDLHTYIHSPICHVVLLL